MEEVKQILANIIGENNIIVSLLYGCGLRIKEALRLRVKDIDFSYNNIYIYDSKSDTDRIVPLPLKLKDRLRQQIIRTQTLHTKELQLIPFDTLTRLIYYKMGRIFVLFKSYWVINLLKLL